MPLSIPRFSPAKKLPRTKGFSGNYPRPGSYNLTTMYREAKGWNHQQLADHAKASRTSIRCWESGELLLYRSPLFVLILSSVSMGIMITYGSYVKPDVDLNKAVNQIEIFDTGVALLAGAMIIPAVYVFSGTEGMSAGPSLMFVSLPKVFNAMGKAGTFVGILFFVTAIFATLTSCISVLESITANCMEIFHSGRKKTVLVLAVIYLAASAVIALGYSIFYFEVQLPNGSAAQLLDIMDYVSNSVMMPFIALLSTILIGWIMTPDYVIDEMQRNGETFRR